MMLEAAAPDAYRCPCYRPLHCMRPRCHRRRQVKMKVLPELDQKHVQLQYALTIYQKHQSKRPRAAEEAACGSGEICEAERCRICACSRPDKKAEAQCVHGAVHRRWLSLSRPRLCVRCARFHFQTADGCGRQTIVDGRRLCCIQCCTVECCILYCIQCCIWRRRFGGHIYGQQQAAPESHYQGYAGHCAHPPPAYLHPLPPSYAGNDNSYTQWPAQAGYSGYGYDSSYPPAGSWAQSAPRDPSGQWGGS